MSRASRRLLTLLRRRGGSWLSQVLGLTSMNWEDVEVNWEDAQMAALTGNQIKDTYKDLLQVSNSNSGIDATLRAVSDGEGTSSPLRLATAGAGLGDLRTGDAASATGFNWFRICSDHATASFNAATSVATFNETQDDLLFFGWNCRYTNEKPYISDEHAWYAAWEADFNDGSNRWTEWYMEFIDSTGTPANNRRPIMTSVNITDYSCVNQFSGECHFYTSDKSTEYLTLNLDDDAAKIQVKTGYIEFEDVAGNPLIKGTNAAGSNSLDVIKLNSDNRVFIPQNLMMMSTNKWLPCLEFFGATDQDGDMIKIVDVGGNVLSRFNKSGTLMTRVVAAPANGDVATSECALWFDNTNGAGKLMIKAKTANGTVVTGSVTLT